MKNLSLKLEKYKQTRNKLLRSAIGAVPIPVRDVQKRGFKAVQMPPPVALIAN